MNKKQSNKITLYLMRHGETILNKAKRTQGWSDGVLTKEGLDIAIDTGLGLSNINFQAVYSSDLGRAIKTAEIVIKENVASNNLNLIKLEELREVYFGKYECELDDLLFNDILNYLNVKSIEEAEIKYDFQKEFCNACATLDETMKAENYDHALNRILTSIKKICMDNYKYKNSNILVVTHGGILRLLIDYLDKNFSLKNIDNCSISTLVYEDGKLSVDSVNDTSFTEKGKAIRMI